ncbi:MAG TPA: heparinase II/III family protein, partial [Arenicellales bacterium]|nr:heparinase II/III family protein [Arenicellales bacterium]
RVAELARPFDVSVRGIGEAWVVKAAHHGYQRLPGRVTHRRSWLVNSSCLVVEDELTGKFTTADACFHFHPDARVVLDGSRGAISLSGGKRIEFAVLEGVAHLRESSHHPEFGLSVASQCLEVFLRNGNSRVVLSQDRSLSESKPDLHQLS